MPRKCGQTGVKCFANLLPLLFSHTNDTALAKNVAAFTIMADGIPIIYAGQEQQYKGGKDPNNREATWLSKYNTDSELYKFIGRANAIRNQAIYTSKDYLTYKVCFSL